MDIKMAIINEAYNTNIDVIGFTSSAPFSHIKHVLEERENKGYLSGFEESDINKRINPRSSMNDCRTIISAGISYNIDESKIELKSDYVLKCKMSKISWGQDYHSVLTYKLKKIAEFIVREFGGNAEVFVDTGPLIDREIASRAGIGYFGKNCSIINPKYGSYIVIGEILTDISIEPDLPLKNECGECDICIKSCPSGALCSPYVVNAKKCISYITQSKNLSPNDYPNIGLNLYGCDVCQNVCPKNKNTAINVHKEFIPEAWNAFPDIVDLIEIDNKTFKNTYKKTSSGWRGKKILQRNAVLAAGNSKKKEVWVFINKMILDDNEEIRKASIYALYNLLGKESFPLFQEQLGQEISIDVRKLLIYYLKK